MDMLSELLPDAGAAKKNAIIHQHGSLYTKAYLLKIRAFEGAGTCVRGLRRQGFDVAIASTADDAQCARYDELLNIFPLCEAVVCGSEVANGKTHPDLFKAVLARL